MFILIDPTNQDVWSICQVNGNEKKEITCKKQNLNLLLCIKKFLEKQKVDLKEIKGFVVVVGKGSFTAIRVATTIVNTFIYIFNLRGLSIKKDETVDLIGLYKKLMKSKKGVFILPSYNGVPNIKKSVFWKKVIK